MRASNPCLRVKGPDKQIQILHSQTLSEKSFIAIYLFPLPVFSYKNLGLFEEYLMPLEYHNFFSNFPSVLDILRDIKTSTSWCTPLNRSVNPIVNPIDSARATRRSICTRWDMCSLSAMDDAVQESPQQVPNKSPTSPQQVPNKSPTSPSHCAPSTSSTQNMHTMQVRILAYRSWEGSICISSR
jgi:hypothetical protein